MLYMIFKALKVKTTSENSHFQSDEGTVDPPYRHNLHHLVSCRLTLNELLGLFASVLNLRQS